MYLLILQSCSAQLVALFVESKQAFTCTYQNVALSCLSNTSYLVALGQGRHVRRTEYVYLVSIVSAYTSKLSTIPQITLSVLI